MYLNTIYYKEWRTDFDLSSVTWTKHISFPDLKIKSWQGSKFQVKSKEVFLKIMRAFPFFSKGFDNKLKAYLKPISLKLSTNECIHMYDRHSFFSSPFESFLNSLEKKRYRNMWFHFLKILGTTLYSFHLDFDNS